MEDKILHQHLNLDPICFNTFKNQIEAVVDVVEKTLTILSDRFCLVFNDWGHGDTHCLDIFERYPAEIDSGHKSLLITFYTMRDETKLDTDEKWNLFKITLQLYKKLLSHVVCFIGDNCKVNNRSARLCDLTMVGCASHRFNLAVVDIVSRNNTIIVKFRNVMVILRKIITAAKLREQSKLKAVLGFPTLWVLNLAC